MAEASQFAIGHFIQEFEKPFIKFLSVVNIAKRCLNCFKQANHLQRCGGCKIAHYCNIECQTVDWKTAHSVECRSSIFRNPQSFLEHDLDIFCELIRLIAYLRLHADEAKKTYQMYDGSSRCFNDLLDHYSEIENVPLIQIKVKEMAAKLSEMDSNLFSAEELDYKNIIHLFGVCRTNSYALSNEDNTELIGCALYVMATSFDHSCRPNAIKFFDRTQRIAIRCIEPIPFGTTPRISYLAGIRDREKRQMVLKERYFFDCVCSYCEEEKKGPLIDYEKLISLKSTLDSERELTDCYLPTGHKIVEMMEKLFYKYDERITDVYLVVLEKLVVCLQGINRPLVNVSNAKVFANDVEKRLQITFGREHEKYEYFVREIMRRLHRA